MKKLTKKGKIVVAAIAFAVIAAAGYFIDKFEKNAYVETIVAKEDAVSYVTTDETAQVEDDRININTADAGELSKLSGIGAAYAERIIKYRTENGNFETIEELMKVPGIGEKKFEQLKNFIRVE